MQTAEKTAAPHRAPRGKIRQPVTGGVAKVPVIMQLEALECGAAALDMVLAYYGLWVPLERVRADCGVSRDGSNARNILRAARSYGLTAQGYRYEPETLRREGKFPCIIHWNFNHFVVLDGFRGDKAYLNDPGQGSYSVPMAEFDNSFTGICLMLAPGPDFQPGGQPKSMAAFAKKRLRGAGVALVFVALTTAIAALINVIDPVLSRIFLDRLLTGQNPAWVPAFLAAMLLFGVVQIIVSWVQAVYTYKVNGKLSITANAGFMWHVLRLPVEYFSQRMAGDISARQGTNETISDTLVQTLAPLVLNTAMMVFYLAVMLRYSIPLTIVGVASILINLAMAQLISKRRINILRVQMRDRGQLTGSTVAGIEMIETIKAAGAENGYFARWSGSQASVNACDVRYNKLDQHIGLIPPIVTTVTDAAILMLGVWLVMQGQFTAGMIFAFQSVMSSFSAPAADLLQASQTMQELRTDMERVEDVLEYPVDVGCEARPAPENPDEVSYDKLTGELELKNITFGYSRLAPPLIENFSMTLHPGSRVAFVGSSGCGKSTLAKLIAGLYQPWSGEILFDGKPIREIDRNVFTGSLAVVDQDVILFEDTIANNIKMWDSSIEDYEMILAARDAHLHEDIMQRDGGYQYKLREGGKDLSGGQRQRLEIARVLAQDPTIMIMDEATSALDAETEYDVVKSIKARGITCIVVAHRLSTIRDSDEIIVMDQGRVVERGTHDELYKKGGLYAELVSNE